MRFSLQLLPEQSSDEWLNMIALADGLGSTAVTARTKSTTKMAFLSRG